MSPPRRWMPLPTSTALIDVGKAEASSRAGVLPDADSFTNRNITCNKDVAAESGDAGELSGGSTPDVCSEGSACLDGDLGVYCECYYPQRTISSLRQVIRRSTTSLLFCFVKIVNSVLVFLFQIDRRLHKHQTLVRALRDPLLSALCTGNTLCSISLTALVERKHNIVAVCPTSP